ncbi:MAG: 5-deoxy-glucuronate isomerase [Chloroflexota bacterium]
MTDGAVPPAVQPSAPPNDLPAERLHLRGGRGDVRLDPATAGWRYLSFAVLELAAGDVRSFGQADHETAVVVLAGGGARVRHKRTSFELVGRASPFEALPTALYLPAGFFGDRQPTIEAVPSVGGSPVTLAVASAPTSGRSDTARQPILIEPSDVRIEVRGAGNATRQINHIIAPDFPADRLEVVEVLTPSGNWSSWPPHKHDVDDMPREAVLEEVYAYRFRRPDAWGLQRLYRADRSRDFAWEVRSGDVVIVTDGYHPFVAAHGDDAYYLNALAGDRRTMACSYDPDLDWVRGTWQNSAADPRVPLVRAQVPAG